MRTYLLYFFACLRLSNINVKPIKKEEHHHYSCAKVVFLFQKNVQQSEKNSYYTKFGKNILQKDIFSPPPAPPRGMKAAHKGVNEALPLGGVGGASLNS